MSRLIRVTMNARVLAAPLGQDWQSAHMTDNVMLPRLTSLRWYAALGVFLFHAGAVTHWRALSVFGIGQAGVTFFFVLSGFVLTWSHREGISTTQFYWRRFARIYPSHATVFTVAVLLGFLTSGLFMTPILGVVLGFVLLQAWTVSSSSYVYAGNAPSWSLSAEAFFYAAFPAILPFLRKWGTRQLVIVTGVVVGSGAAATIMLARAGYGSTAAFNFPLVLLPQFILGVAVALLMQRGMRIPFSWLLAGLAMVLTIIAAEHAPDFPFQDYVLLPGVAVLLAAGATQDLRGTPGLLTHPVSVWLGEVSFAFYLVHQGTLLVLHTLADWNSVVETFAALAMSLGLAAAIHHLIELPAQRSLTRRSRSPSSDRSDGLTRPSRGLPEAPAAPQAPESALRERRE